MRRPSLRLSAPPQTRKSNNSNGTTPRVGNFCDSSASIPIHTNSPSLILILVCQENGKQGEFQFGTFNEMTTCSTYNSYK